MASVNPTVEALEQLLETVSFYIGVVSSLLPTGAAKAVEYTAHSHDGVATALKTKNELKTLMTEEHALVVGGPLLGGLEGAMEAILETLLPMKVRIKNLIDEAKASSGGTDTEEKMKELEQELQAVKEKLGIAKRAKEAADKARTSAMERANARAAELKAASNNLKKQKEEAQERLRDVQKQAETEVIAAREQGMQLLATSRENEAFQKLLGQESKGRQAASQAAARASKATGEAGTMAAKVASQAAAQASKARQKASEVGAQVASQAKAQAKGVAGKAGTEAAARAEAATKALAKAKLASWLPSRRAKKQKKREAEKKNLIDAHEALLTAQKNLAETPRVPGGLAGVWPSEAKKRRKEAKKALKEKQDNFQKLVDESTMNNSDIARSIKGYRVSKTTADLEAARVAEQEARKKADATKAPLELAEKARSEARAEFVRSQAAHKAALMDDNASTEVKKQSQRALKKAEQKWLDANASMNKAEANRHAAVVAQQAASRQVDQANRALGDANAIQEVTLYRGDKSALDRALNRRELRQTPSPTTQEKSDQQTSIADFSALEKNLSRKGEKAQAAVTQALGRIGKKLTPEQIRDGLNESFRDRVSTAAEAARNQVSLAQTDLHGARHQATLAKMEREEAEIKASTAPSDDEGRVDKAAAKAAAKAKAALEEAKKKHEDAQRNQKYAESKLENALADQATIQKIAASNQEPNQGPYTESEVKSLQAGQMGMRENENQERIDALRELQERLKAAQEQRKLQRLLGPSMTTNCKDCSFNQVCVNNECMDLDGSDCSDGSPCPKGQVCEDEVCTYVDDIPDPDPPQVQNGGANALKDWRTMNKGVAAIGADATAVADASSRIQRNTATIVAISNRLHKLAGTMRH